MGRRGWVVSSLLAAMYASVLGVTACGGRSERNDIEDDGAHAGRSGSPRGTSGTGAAAGVEEPLGGRHPGAAGGSGTSAAAGIGGMGGGPLDCSSPNPPATALRRLNLFQFNNTVRAVFGEASRPADAFPSDSAPYGPGGLDSATELEAEQIHEYAHAFAADATADAARIDALTNCDVAAEGEAACGKRFNEYVIRVVFRQPLTPEALAELEELFETGRELGGNFASGVRAVLEVALQSPEFLYHVEFGEPLEDAAAADPTVGRPSPHEMASRLSYLLLGSSPDSELRGAADAGALRTPEQVEAQARRLLRSPLAHEVLFRFHAHLLNFDRVEALVGKLESAGFGGIADAAMEETARFIGDVAWSGAGGFERLWSSPSSWINGPLGVLYGHEEVTGAAFRPVDLDPSRRGGLLTRVAFLSSSTISGHSDALRRGVRIATPVLCLPQGAPAAHPAFTPPGEVAPNATARQKHETATTASAACTVCHQHIDPLGFAFEHYDSFGRWRDTDNGQPVDATGELFQTDAAGTFDGALELSALIAQSEDAKSCYAGQWMSYAFARPEVPQDACSRQTVEEAFARSGGDIVELIVASTQTEGFLYRRLDQVSP